MPQITLARSALRDLDSIWDYIAENDPDRASRFIRQLRQKMELLAEQPLMGRLREDLSKNLRAFVFGDYVAYYYPEVDGVLVTRVLHGRRNVEPDLFET